MGVVESASSSKFDLVVLVKCCLDSSETIFRTLVCQMLLQKRHAQAPNHGSAIFHLTSSMLRLDIRDEIFLNSAATASPVYINESASTPSVAAKDGDCSLLHKMYVIPKSF